MFPIVVVRMHSNIVEEVVALILEKGVVPSATKVEEGILHETGDKVGEAVGKIVGNAVGNVVGVAVVGVIVRCVDVKILVKLLATSGKASASGDDLFKSCNSIMRNFVGVFTR
jgi:hypothetical protein